MEDYHLPPTKIKRQYKCNICPHSTVNPRIHLRHLNDIHDQKVKIVECPFCVYACQYKQKLNRHLRLVHNNNVNRNNHSNKHQQQLNQQHQSSQYEQDDSYFQQQQDEPIDLSYPQELKQLIRIMENQAAATFLEAQLAAAQPYNRPVTAQQLPNLADLQMPDYPVSQFGYNWNYD